MNRRQMLMSLMALPGVARIERAEVKPGEVIVIEHPGLLSDAIATRITDHLKTIWPDNKAIVLCDGMKLKVVFQMSTDHGLGRLKAPDERDRRFLMRTPLRCPKCQGRLQPVENTVRSICTECAFEHWTEE